MTKLVYCIGEKLSFIKLKDQAWFFKQLQNLLKNFLIFFYPFLEHFYVFQVYKSVLTFFCWKDHVDSLLEGAFSVFKTN